MTLWILALAVSFGASLLTFFSGFGLGTLLLPVFAVFFAAEAAVMMTAVVHLLNNLFKIGLIGRHVHFGVLLRFGVPALFAAMLGGALLVQLATWPAVVDYSLAGKQFVVRPAGLVIGIIMVIFAVHELASARTSDGLDRRWLPVGGLLSGFLGGLAGHQGALRSAFLMKAGLTKEGFIATGIAIAVAVDLGRLGLYLPNAGRLANEAPLPLLAATTVSAFAGALVGRRLLHKVTLEGVYRVVGVLLIVAGIAMAAGLI